MRQHRESSPGSGSREPEVSSPRIACWRSVGIRPLARGARGALPRRPPCGPRAVRKWILVAARTRSRPAGHASPPRDSGSWRMLPSAPQAPGSSCSRSRAAGRRLTGAGRAVAPRPPTACAAWRAARAPERGREALRRWRWRSGRSSPAGRPTVPCSRRTPPHAGTARGLPTRR